MTDTLLRRVALTLGLALSAGCTPHSNGDAPPPAQTLDHAEPSPPPPASAAAPVVDDAEAQAPEAGEASPELTGAVNRFGGDLARLLAAKPGNLAYSPLSISVALAMTQAGARGRTADQMARVLHSGAGGERAARHAALVQRLTSASGEGAPELAVANRLWADRSTPLVPAFVKLTGQQFGAPVEQVDFVHAAEASRKSINAWVAEQTRDKISELLPKGSVDDLTRLVLTNAIYLKAAWATPFSKDATKDAPFYVGGTSKKQLPTMHAQLSARTAKLADAAVLELPYRATAEGPELSMLLVLPERRDGIAEVEQRVYREGIDAILGKLEGQRVDVALPRFEASVRFELKPLLAKLGMPDAFQPGKADFSGMFQDAGKAMPYHVDEVYHQAFVVTDEAGTEAAAATAVTMSPRGMALGKPVPFHVDHPFLFMIRDARSGVILFAGRVTDPAG